MKHLFFGGIHPKYNKEMSKTTPEVKTIVPKTVVIPMVQHIGAPCTPLVQVGDRVLKGQKLLDRCESFAMWVDAEGNMFYSTGFEELIRT